MQIIGQGQLIFNIYIFLVFIFNTKFKQYQALHYYMPNK